MPRPALSRLLAVLFLFSIARVTFAQSPAPVTTQAPVRDPQALALLQTSAAAMAATMPSDSTATGSINVVAGSGSDEGTIRILTKGTSETSVQVQTSRSSWSVTYANSSASRTDGSATTPVYLEQAASSRCVYFPYPVIADLVTNQDAAFTYIGPESLNLSSVQHIRAWNTFNSNTPYRFLAAFTVIDIWLDATSGLPQQISFISRSGGGSTPKIPITVNYSNYQNHGGVLYPYQIQESVNGTLWATVTIQSVAFNSGLSDANFTVATGAN